MEATYTQDNLEGLKVSELREICINLGLLLPKGHTKKAELISQILDATKKGNKKRKRTDSDVKSAVVVKKQRLDNEVKGEAKRPDEKIELKKLIEFNDPFKRAFKTFFATETYLVESLPQFEPWPALYLRTFALEDPTKKAGDKKDANTTQNSTVTLGDVFKNYRIEPQPFVPASFLIDPEHDIAIKTLIDDLIQNKTPSFPEFLNMPPNTIEMLLPALKILQSLTNKKSQWEKWTELDWTIHAYSFWHFVLDEFQQQSDGKFTLLTKKVNAELYPDFACYHNETSVLLLGEDGEESRSLFGHKDTAKLILMMRHALSYKIEHGERSPNALQVFGILNGGPKMTLLLMKAVFKKQENNQVLPMFQLTWFGHANNRRETALYTDARQVLEVFFAMYLTTKAPMRVDDQNSKSNNNQANNNNNFKKSQVIKTPIKALTQRSRSRNSGRMEEEYRTNSAPEKLIGNKKRQGKQKEKVDDEDYDQDNDDADGNHEEDDDQNDANNNDDYADDDADDSADNDDDNGDEKKGNNQKDNKRTYKSKRRAGRQENSDPRDQDTYEDKRRRRAERLRMQSYREAEIERVFPEGGIIFNKFVIMERLHEDYPHIKIMQAWGKEGLIEAIGKLSDCKLGEDILNPAQVQFMKRFDHPHILKFIGWTPVSQRHYVMVIPHVKDRKIELRSLEEVRVCLRQLLSVMQYLHAKKIIHGDVKFDNVIVEKVDNRPHLYLIDFELTKYEPSDIVEGTRGHMAPEIENGGKYGTKVDLYAFGVTAFELMFNTPALLYCHRNGMFRDLDPDDITTVDIRRAILKLLARKNEYSEHSLYPHLRSLIVACLENDPKRRLSATEAMNHEFFGVRPGFKVVKNSKSLQREGKTIETRRSRTALKNITNQM